VDENSNHRYSPPLFMTHSAATTVLTQLHPMGQVSDSLRSRSQEMKRRNSSANSSACRFSLRRKPVLVRWSLSRTVHPSVGKGQPPHSGRHSVRRTNGNGSQVGSAIVCPRGERCIRGSFPPMIASARDLDVLDAAISRGAGRVPLSQQRPPSLVDGSPRNVISTINVLPSITEEAVRQSCSNRLALSSVSWPRQVQTGKADGPSCM